MFDQLLAQQQARTLATDGLTALPDDRPWSPATLFALDTLLRELRGLPARPEGAPALVRLGLGAATPPAVVAVARVLEVARHELGTVEQPTNRTRYGQWCGMDGNPWCAMFVNWVLSQAGIPGFERPVAGFPYTPRGVQLFQSGQLGSWLSPGAVALPGDVVFFSFARRDGDGRPLADHVGLVERVTGAVLHTIEGNTTSGAAGNQRNGGGVYRRTRSGSVILGYGRPRYGARP